MVYIRVNELSTPRRNGGGSAALAEPLLSSGHRAFATDSSSCPAPRSPVGRHATARPLAGARAAENLPPASEARASGFPFLPCARKRLADCDRQRGSAQGGARKEKEVPDGKQSDYHHTRKENRALPALERRPRHRRAAASVLRAPGLPPAQLRQLRVGPHPSGRRQLLRRHTVGRYRSLHRRRGHGPRGNDICVIEGWRIAERLTTEYGEDWKPVGVHSVEPCEEQRSYDFDEMLWICYTLLDSSERD